MEKQIKAIINSFENFIIVNFANENENSKINNNKINIQFRYDEFKNIANIKNYMNEKADILINIFNDIHLDICIKNSEKLPKDIINCFISEVEKNIKLSEKEEHIWNTPYSHFKFNIS